MIYKKSKQTMNFRVSLSKEQSTLLEKTHQQHWWSEISFF